MRVQSELVQSLLCFLKPLIHIYVKYIIYKSFNIVFFPDYYCIFEAFKSIH
jgi:hypothetical protein